MSETGIDARAGELLKLLVERYIRDGQPVGSRTLSREGRIQVSPATVRNVMSDLDAMGFVASPHTSAGRIPTNRGYRYFVDSLLVPETLDQAEMSRIASDLLKRELEPDELVEAASQLLSSLSSMAGLVTVPRRNHVVLRRIDFVRLSGRRVLAVLVVNNREVQNRIIHTDRDYGEAELSELSNAISQQYAGQDLLSLRARMMDEVSKAKDQMNRTLLTAVQLVGDALNSEQSGSDYVIHGGTNLMGFNELADLQRLRSLFDAFDRKRELLDLFDHCLDAAGVQVFIGDESGYDILDECTVITAPYRINGEVAGVLSVIGPTRMAYSRLIPMVGMTAGALGKALSEAE